MQVNRYRRNGNRPSHLLDPRLCKILQAYKVLIASNAATLLPSPRVYALEAKVLIFLKILDRPGARNFHRVHSRQFHKTEQKLRTGKIEKEGFFYIFSPSFAQTKFIGDQYRLN